MRQFDYINYMQQYLTFVMGNRCEISALTYILVHVKTILNSTIIVRQYREKIKMYILSKSENKYDDDPCAKNRIDVRADFQNDDIM